MIFKFFIIALIVFAAFRILNVLSERLTIHLIQKNRLNYLLPLLEFFVWILYVLWVVKLIYDSKNYFALLSIAVVFALIAYPFFILIRDFISGIILKIQNKVAVGMHIEIEEIKGLIAKAGHLSMDMEDGHGNITSINYHYAYGKKISRSGNNLNLEKISLAFEFPESSRLNELISQLKKEVMNTPWVAISQPLIIENTKVKNGKVLIKVAAFVLDRSYAENIKTSVMSYFSSI